jgi:ABC-type phosphate transport system substrate-binding protein
MSGIAVADIAVIVNPAAGVDAASKEEIARLFLSKTTNIKGVSLTPIDQVEGNKTRDAFYQKVGDKTASQLNAYWSRLIFTGKGQPPDAVSDDAEAIQTVSEDTGSIGYVDAASVNSSVKVIFTAP